MADTQRVAARPIPLDMSKVDMALESLLHSTGMEVYDAYDEPDGAAYPTRGGQGRATLSLTTVDGRRVTIKLFLLPGKHRIDELRDLFAGAYSASKQQLALFIPRDLQWDVLNSPAVKAKLRAVLVHELTHASDVLNDGGYDGRAEVQDEEWTRKYLNDPQEIRAFMAQAVSEIYDFYVTLTTRLRKSHGDAVMMALKSKFPRWKELDRYLTRRNRQTFLKGVERGLRERRSERLARASKIARRFQGR